MEIPLLGASGTGFLINAVSIGAGAVLSAKFGIAKTIGGFLGSTLPIPTWALSLIVIGVVAFLAVKFAGSNKMVLNLALGVAVGEALNVVSEFIK